MAEKDKTIAPSIYGLPRVLECRELDDELLLQESYKRLDCNLALVLHEAVLCGICLEKHLNLSQLNFKDSTQTGGSFTHERMMLEIFDYTVIRDLPSSHICNKCKEHVRQNYIFMQRVKNSSKILNSYITQMNSQLDDVINFVESASSNNEEVSNSVLILENLVKVENDIVLNEKPKAAKEYTFACDICTSKFQTKSAVTTHTRNLHSKVKKIVSCSQCHDWPCAHEKFLVSIRDQKAKGAKVLRCSEPGCDYENRHGTPFILDHANAHHLNIKPHVCNECFKTYHTKKTLEGHRLTCLNKNCMYCDQKLNSVDLKLTHEADCKLISKSFKCQQCTDTFGTELLLLSHLRRTHRRYRCTMCKSVCQSMAALRVHQLHAHNKEQQPKPCGRTPQTYKCFLCPKKFKNMMQVREHQSQAHKKNEKYECELCHMEFSERTIFLNHRITHKQQDSFKCDQCPYSSKSSVLLESHINTAHRHIRPHVCQTCFKTFTTLKYLQFHEAKHTKTKHQCPYCTALLAGGQRGIETHILRRHSDTKPFCCKHCEMKYAVKSDLDLHYIRKHGGEKKFVCPLCGLKHGVNGELRAHITRTHAKGMVLDDFIMSHGTSHPQLLEIFKDRTFNNYPNVRK